VEGRGLRAKSLELRSQGERDWKEGFK